MVFCNFDELDKVLIQAIFAAFTGEAEEIEPHKLPPAPRRIAEPGSLANLGPYVATARHKSTGSSNTTKIGRAVTPLEVQIHRPLSIMKREWNFGFGMHERADLVEL